MAVNGDVRGLDAAIRDYLGHYVPGPEGLSGIQSCVYALTDPLWASFGVIRLSTSASIGAGVVSATVIYTTPRDRRTLLESMIVYRATGDNDLQNFSIQPDADYIEGGATLYFIEMATFNQRMYWPDTGGRQDVNYLVNPGPMLLEPGTSIRFTTGGAGASASTFASQLVLRQTKLVRALAPVET